MAKKKVVKQDEKALMPRGYSDTFEMSEMELAELSSQIQKDILEGENDKQTWLQEREKDVKAFFGIKKQTDWPFKGAAKVSSQLHRIMVETMAANIISSLNAPEKMIDVKPYNSGSIENSKYVSDLMNTDARYGYKLDQVADRAIPNALIESFVVLKPVYEICKIESVNSVKRLVPQELPIESLSFDSDTNTVLANGQPVPSVDPNDDYADSEDMKKAGLQEVTFDITKEQITHDGIKVYAINGSHIYLPIWSPGETPFEKYQRAPYVIHKEFPTVQEMAMWQEQGYIKNMERLKDELFYKELNAAKGGTSLNEATILDLKYNQAGSVQSSQLDRKQMENLWWYGKFKYKGKLREMIAYVNRDTGTVLKLQINQIGIRPFFPIVPFPVDETPFGESLPKKIRPLINELELAMNTVLNMGMIKAYPPKFYDPMGGLDPKTLGNFGPNSYIPVRDPSKNVFMPPQPEDPRILMEMVRLIMDLVERVTGNSDAVQGQVSQTANTTAFEVQQALLRSGIRFTVIYERIRKQLEPMFDYNYRLNLKHMPYEREVRIMGEQALESGFSKLYTISKENVAGSFGFTLAGNSVMQEAAELQKAQQLFATFGQDPYLSYKPESAYYLRYNLLKHFNPIAMDKILPKPEEVQQLLRDRAQVQMEQEKLALAEQQMMGGMNGAPGMDQGQGPATA